MSLVITPGMGIGPEVTVRALAARPRHCLLVGRAAPVLAEAATAGLAVEEVPEPALGSGIRLWEPTRGDEPVPVAAIRKGVELCLEGAAKALVTGPIHKARLAEQGFDFPGHTGFLGHLCGVGRPVMAFAAPGFVLSLVTVHIPLAQVAEALDEADIVRVIDETGRAARRRLDKEPRIAVCGLNPHAGDEGLLGREEIEVIAPACERARAEGWDIAGPVSAETAFVAVSRGELDAIVAMYHDQGLAPLKAMWFGRTVNWTLGLPIVRTSVDHGTADSLVGTGRADPASMEEAISLAESLTT